MLFYLLIKTDELISPTLPYSCLTDPFEEAELCKVFEWYLWTVEGVGWAVMSVLTLIYYLIISSLTFFQPPLPQALSL